MADLENINYVNQPNKKALLTNVSETMYQIRLLCTQRDQYAQVQSLQGAYDIAQEKLLEEKKKKTKAKKESELAPPKEIVVQDFIKTVMNKLFTTLDASLLRDCVEISMDTVTGPGGILTQTTQIRGGLYDAIINHSSAGIETLLHKLETEVKTFVTGTPTQQQVVISGYSHPPEATGIVVDAELPRSDGKKRRQLKANKDMTDTHVEASLTDPGPHRHQTMKAIGWEPSTQLAQSQRIVIFTSISDHITQTLEKLPIDPPDQRVAYLGEIKKALLLADEMSKQTAVAKDIMGKSYYRLWDSLRGCLLEKLMDSAEIDIQTLLELYKDVFEGLQKICHATGIAYIHPMAYDDFSISLDPLVHSLEQRSAQVQQQVALSSMTYAALRQFKIETKLDKIEKFMIVKHLIDLRRWAIELFAKTEHDISGRSLAEQLHADPKIIIPRRKAYKEKGAGAVILRSQYGDQTLQRIEKMNGVLDFVYALHKIHATLSFVSNNSGNIRPAPPPAAVDVPLSPVIKGPVKPEKKEIGIPADMIISEDTSLEVTLTQSKGLLTAEEALEVADAIRSDIVNTLNIQKAPASIQGQDREQLVGLVNSALKKYKGSPLKKIITSINRILTTFEMKANLGQAERTSLLNLKFALEAYGSKDNNDVKEGDRSNVKRVDPKLINKSGGIETDFDYGTNT